MRVCDVHVGLWCVYEMERFCVLVVWCTCVVCIMWVGWEAGNGEREIEREIKRKNL